ncbi:unnamed protein product [Effrenium voratum]|uniref:Apicomplexan-conserved protein n=1 Tax=Effrenium voratum TaxID=2562239 RepID=A0AA36HX37_9DINO|nr:unnamed protein product [Effrenium voratum]
MDAVSERSPDREKDLEGTDLPRPPSASTKQETCFVFDWDDTILPTSWLERIHALAGGGPLRPEVQRQLASLCSAVVQTLQLAASLGSVIIITNSAPGWVDQSCQIFMPQILPQVRSYPIFAKPLHAPLTFKITTFRRECKKWTNLISIGDGDAERAASLRLQARAFGAMSSQFLLARHQSASLLATALRPIWPVRRSLTANVCKGLRAPQERPLRDQGPLSGQQSLFSWDLCRVAVNQCHVDSLP